MSRKADKKTGTKPKKNHSNTAAATNTGGNRKAAKAAGKTSSASQTAKRSTAAMNHAPATQPNQTAEQNTGQVIPFRQPGWDRQNPWLVNQQMQQQARGYAPVAHRFNHGRGK